MKSRFNDRNVHEPAFSAIKLNYHCHSVKAKLFFIPKTV